MALLPFFSILIITIFSILIITIFLSLVYIVYKNCGPHARQESNNHVSEQRGPETFLQTIRVLEFDPERYKEGLQCAVCLSEVKEGEKTRVLPECEHGFHMECIDMWFHSHSTCPICRNPLVNDQIGDEADDYRHKGSTSELASSSSLEC